MGTVASAGILFLLSLSILFCIMGMIKVGWVPGSSPSGSRGFEGKMASAIRKQ